MIWTASNLYANKIQLLHLTSIKSIQIMMLLFGYYRSENLRNIHFFSIT